VVVSLPDVIARASSASALNMVTTMSHTQTFTCSLLLDFAVFLLANLAVCVAITIASAVPARALACTTAVTSSGPASTTGGDRACAGTTAELAGAKRCARE